MKTNVHLGYIADFLLEWKIISSKCVENLQTRISYYFSFSKIVSGMG